MSSTWIACDDRKPVENVVVLVSVQIRKYAEDDEGNERVFDDAIVDLGQYRGPFEHGDGYMESFGSPYSDSECGDSEWITHWMPLPEPAPIPQPKEAA